MRVLTMQANRTQQVDPKRKPIPTMPAVREQMAYRFMHGSSLDAVRHYAGTTPAGVEEILRDAMRRQREEIWDLKGRLVAESMRRAA